MNLFLKYQKSLNELLSYGNEGKVMKKYIEILHSDIFSNVISFMKENLS